MFRFCRETQDRISEAKAAAGLGNVHLGIGDIANAVKYHQLDLRLSQQFEDSSGKIRAFGNLGSAFERLENKEESIKMFECQLSESIQMADHVGQTNALGSLGKKNYFFFMYIFWALLKPLILAQPTDRLADLNDL